jgi:very-short-patch-repair endonuclease
MPESLEKSMYYGASPITFEKAKALRHSMTEAEKELWKVLSKNKFMGLRFKPQHPINRFIADFYCHLLKLVIEVDGGIHSLPENKDYDIQRSYEIEKWNIEIIRFTNDQVFSNKKLIIDKLYEVCKRRKAEFENYKEATNP